MTGDDRTDLERRLDLIGDDMDSSGWSQQSVGIIRRAADLLGEQRRALEAALRRIALMTPMGGSEVEDLIADECDRVREQIRAALAKGRE